MATLGVTPLRSPLIVVEGVPMTVAIGAVGRLVREIADTPVTRMQCFDGATIVWAKDVSMLSEVGVYTKRVRDGMRHIWDYDINNDQHVLRMADGVVFGLDREVGYVRQWGDMGFSILRDPVKILAGVPAL